jgi:LacI family transcriptional regulator
MTSLTLEEIAKQAGVSRSTVSRVINRQPNVREQVRTRVLNIIQETGYQPNMAARSLASQHSNVIALVIPRSVQNFFTDPYFPRLTQGVAQACNQYDYTLSLFLFHTEDDERKLFPRITRKGMVDGIIIQATYASDELFEQLHQGDVPYVVAGRPTNDSQASFVDVDNITGTLVAVRHLIHQGRQRIGTIAGPLVTTAGLDRYEGYQQALRESSLSLDKNLIAEGDFSEISGYYCTQRMLPYHPDALFIASDTMAIGALRAIREAGLVVPDDIAIVSYDDLPPSSQSTPRLTTVRQPIRRMGIKLVEMLVDIIEIERSSANTPHPPHRILFGTELVVRESCGALKLERTQAPPRNHFQVEPGSAVVQTS